VAGHSVVVSQNAAPCTAAVTPSDIATDAAGSFGELHVSAAWGCATSPATDVPWIHVVRSGYAGEVLRDAPSAYWRLGEPARRRRG
jgi:hypothetical protein